MKPSHCDRGGFQEIRMLKTNSPKNLQYPHIPAPPVNHVISPCVVICIQILAPCHIFLPPIVPGNEPHLQIILPSDLINETGERVSPLNSLFE